MKNFRYISLLLLFAVTASAQTFADFLARLNTTPLNQRPALVDSFINAVPAFPYLEQDTLAHFIYRGNASTITVPGDANNWNINGSPMTRVEGTDFWYRSEIYEEDARLDYKFVLNGSNWILDPRNPNTVTGGYGPNSELRMPAYIIPPEIFYYGYIFHGTYEDTLFYSVNMGNSRTIRVYLPSGYQSSTTSYPMILFHDGLEYTTLGSAINVLDYLIDRDLVEPVIAVFVPPVNRTEEYAGSLQGQFTQFIVNEVMPWVDSKYRTIPLPEKRAVLGASNGGNISLWLALNHPEVFGHVAAQSSNIQNSISSGFQNSPLLDLKLYLDLGTYDIPILIQLVNNFLPLLQAKGYPYQYHVFHEGHSWGNWRAHIDNALIMFFPGTATRLGTSYNSLTRYKLSQNYPNPFNSRTTITFELPERCHVSLIIYNGLGEIVARFYSGILPPGSYKHVWEASELPSGIYLYRLKTGSSVEIGKMIMIK
ncbi:MAG: T9SS type A sorting domain-containing protein [bacterium]|nr:MAG: T9SS type A sorting domain-containing protein [bacterium]